MGQGALPRGGRSERGRAPRQRPGSPRPALGSLPCSTWTSRTSPPAGAAAWPSAPSSTSSSLMPSTTLPWSPHSADTTSPWPSLLLSKPRPRMAVPGGVENTQLCLSRNCPSAQRTLARYLSLQKRRGGEFQVKIKEASSNGLSYAMARKLSLYPAPAVCQALC